MLNNDRVEGISKSEFSKNNVKITRIEVLDEQGSKNLGKPLGKYITAELSDFAGDSELLDGRLDVLAEELSSLLPKDGLILIAGLGNDSVTPDALGPKCIDFVLATRHIGEDFSKQTGFESFRPVAGIIPGVLGKTGIETGEIISGITKCIKPAAVITVDALCSGKLSRLGKTIQMTDTGIVPGSGVGNSRIGINRELLGVDVISIGVPTVVDSLTLAREIAGSNSHPSPGAPSGLIVTPTDIDLMIEHASRLVGMMINHALQPRISCEDILSLVT